MAHCQATRTLLKISFDLVQNCYLPESLEAGFTLVQKIGIIGAIRGMCLCRLVGHLQFRFGKLTEQFVDRVASAGFALHQGFVDQRADHA